MKEYEANAISKTRYELAESPFYDARFRRLSWVDIISGRIFTANIDGIRSELNPECYCEMNEMTGAAVPTADGDSFIAAATKGLYRLSRAEKTLLLDMQGEFEPVQRCNDAKADPMGRLFFGSTVFADGIAPHGKLYCAEGGRFIVKDADTLLANGMAWSRDHKRFFFSDSERHAVYEYNYDLSSGMLSGKRELLRIEDAVPDGMCIDASDRLWIAVWGGYRIECFDTVKKEKTAVVHLPARQVSSCCFAGEALDTLFITTAAVGLKGDADGRLYACRVEDATGLLPDLAVC